MVISNMLKSKLEESLKGQLIDLIRRDYSMIAGEKIQQMFASDIMNLIDENLKESWRLDIGQALWLAVDKDDKPSYGKNVKNIRFRPVILTLISKEDLDARANGFNERELREKRAVRMFNEAFEQNGVLSLNDVALFMGCSITTIGKQIREYMERERKIVPTRGTIHDLGRTFTHKKLIIQHYLQGLLTPEIAKICGHSEEACDRYIRAFNNVRRLAGRMDEEEIARTLEMSRSLVKEYLEIMKEHNGGKKDAAL